MMLRYREKFIVKFEKKKKEKKEMSAVSHKRIYICKNYTD